MFKTDFFQILLIRIVQAILSADFDEANIIGKILLWEITVNEYVFVFKGTIARTSHVFETPNYLCHAVCLSIIITDVVRFALSLHLYLLLNGLLCIFI